MEKKRKGLVVVTRPLLCNQDIREGKDAPD